MTIKIYKSFLPILLVFLSYSGLRSQDRLFELNVRAAGLGSFGVLGSEGYAGLGINAELLYFFKPKIGAGIFYTQTPFMLGYSDIGNAEGQYGLYADFEYLMYGVTAQLTTNRARFFRVYGTVRFFKVEMVHHYTGYSFTLAESGYGYSGGIGVGLKISDTIGYNLFEINYVGLPKSFDHASKFSYSSYAGALIQSGLIIKIRKRK
jgi:hypothetical protein